jgi:hypothetical protein
MYVAVAIIVGIAAIYLVVRFAVSRLFPKDTA